MQQFAGSPDKRTAKTFLLSKFMIAPKAYRSVVVSLIAPRNGAGDDWS
jgi:hypothetical protein